MKPLRVGLIGAGYIASAHSAGWRAVGGTYGGRTPSVVLQHAVDSDLQRAWALSSSWGWKHAGSDWHEVTQSDDVDLVDVCVPNHLHEAVVVDALEHGKHVVCEKPLAPDPASALRMLQAVGRTDRVAQVCFFYRLWPAIAWARKLIADGAIGSVQHFRGWMLQDYASSPDHPMGWRTDKTRAGAGALGDLGSHIIDIACALAGDIDSVCSMVRSTVQRSGEVQSDDLASVLVRFAGGASGVIETSWAMPGHACDLGFDVVGTEGAIRFSWERSNEMQILLAGDDPRQGFKTVLVGPGVGDAGAFVAVAGQGLGYRDAFTAGLGAAAAAIADPSIAVEPSFADGLRACQIIDAIQRSAVDGRWAAPDQASA